MRQRWISRPFWAGYRSRPRPIYFPPSQTKTGLGLSQQRPQRASSGGFDRGQHRPPATPSCFLFDSYIQYAWDSTSLGYLKTCPRLYYYHMICGYIAKDESIHLRFGSEYHSAIQDFEIHRASGLQFEDALRETVRLLLIRIKDWDPDITTKAGTYKNPRTLVQLVVDYFDNYRQDSAKTIILENGRPAVELSFRFALDFGPTGHPETQYML